MQFFHSLVELLLLLLISGSSDGRQPCVARQTVSTYGPGWVCVCNSTYCDTVDPLGDIPENGAVVYLSSASGQQLERSETNFSKQPSLSSAIVVTVNSTTKLQEIIGFGGAFTDSAGISIYSLRQTTRNFLIDGYFNGNDGLGYTLGRVPIAGADFSSRKYTYVEADMDLDLVTFNLTLEDYTFKLPLIKEAQRLSPELRLFSSAWSAPGWMKRTGDEGHGGRLKGSVAGPYYQSWANYLVRFLERYAEEGVSFWALTAENEPSAGWSDDYAWNALGFNSSEQRDFIKWWLGPAMRNSPVANPVKLLILDDQRYLLPHWADVVLNDTDAAQHVHGIAVHWYENFWVPPSVLDETHARHPDYIMLATEACNGYFPFDLGPKPGEWTRADIYAHDVIENLNHWVAGWTDWNLALDMTGGPNWANNLVDAPILVDAEAEEFYRQPMYYALGHFSKFMRPGSWRVPTSVSGIQKHVEAAATVDKDGRRALVVLNRHPSLNYTVRVKDLARKDKEMLQIEMPAQSIATFVWESA